MKVVLAWLLAVLLVLVSSRPDEKYTTKYDNIDLDPILNSNRLLENYVNCLMDRGTCPPNGAELKKSLPEALKTDCAKCSDKQKSDASKVLHHLAQHNKEWFDEVLGKYDPENTYRNKHKEDFKKDGIEI